MVAAAGLSGPEGRADVWTGAGETALVRNWPIAPNWAGGVVPPANDAATFGVVGDGTVALVGVQSAGGLIFQNFAAPAIGLPGETLVLVNPPWPGRPFVKTNEEVRDTYGCDYFTAGPRLDADLVLGDDLEIYMGTANNSSLMISGAIVGGFDRRITLFDDAAGAGTGRINSLWFTTNNADYRGDVTVNSRPNSLGTSIKLADAGRLGTATITLNGNLAGLGLLGTAPGLPPNLYRNSIVSRSGGSSCPVVHADRSYQQNVFAGERDVTQYTLTQYILDVTLDNPTGNSAIAFGSQAYHLRTHNGYTLYGDGLILGTSNPMANTKTVYVNLGNYTEGRAGHRHVGGVNNLNRSINEAWFSGDPHPSLRDAGQTLIKAGLGILELGADNAQESPAGSGAPASSGAKRIDEGVLRFNRPESIGRTPAGGQPPIILNLVGGRVSAGVGIGWDGLLPVITTAVGTAIGQSGALCIDTDGEDHNGDGSPEHAAQYTQVLDFFNDPNLQRLRLGSSSRTGAIIPNAPVGDLITPNPDGVYHVGGGGGTLFIYEDLPDYLGEARHLEMATTGTLLPGRVVIHEDTLYSGETRIYAGTLQLADRLSVWQSVAVLVGTTCDNFDGTYWAPRAPFAFAGPGQLLLDPGIEYVFRSTPRLDGGAVGWRLPGGAPAFVVLSALGQIGTYGQTLNSTLAGPTAVPTNLLHLGGEYSAGVMTKTAAWTIADNGTTPVALVKSGLYSSLDLTGGGPNTYTGGTAILGGEVVVSQADQLGSGPVLIANGGRLRVTESTEFPHTLKGLTRGTPDVNWWNGSVIEVDADRTATFTGPVDNALSPRTPFEKVGEGTLVLDYRVAGVPAAYPRGPANQWGLKLAEGLVSINQLPLGAAGNADNGFLVCLGGDLLVRPAPPGTSTADPDYGFSALASFQDTTSTLTVQDGALFRANGRWEHTFMGTIILAAQDTDGDPANNRFHFSHNGTGEAPPVRDSRGTGTLDVRGGTVLMTTNAAYLGVLPQEAAFTLVLNGGVFDGMPQATLNGNLEMNTLTGTTLPTPPRVDGAVFTADGLASAPTSWTLAGTGATRWRGVLEKVGPGIVTFSRSLGATVAVDPGGVGLPVSTLRITGGTVNAGGSADPFTDTTSATRVTVQNGATFNVTAGAKAVADLTGNGTTNVAAGASLAADRLQQRVLSLGAGAAVTIGWDAVPAASQARTLDVANPLPGAATLALGPGETLTVTGTGGCFSIGAGSALLKTGPGTLTVNQAQRHGPGSVLAVEAGTANINTDAGPTGGPLAFAPGLVAGRLNGPFNVTDPNPATAVQAGLVQMNYAGNSDAIVWADNTTWVYTGQFYEDDGLVSFGENFDDSVLLRVDVNGDGLFDPGPAETWLNDTSWNTPTTSGPRVLAPDQWYTFEARFGQGVRGIGPVEGWSVGLGWDTAGGTNYVTPPDALFRRPLGEGSLASGRNLTVNANGTVRFGATQHLAALNVGAGATQLTPGGAKVLVTDDLWVDVTDAVLDLTDNDLIVDYTDGAPSPLPQVAAWIRSGLNRPGGGYWDGTGLTSSAAAGDPWQLTALGVLDNTDPWLGGRTTFSGEPVDASSVLVKYTWWGDANLDGRVTLDDYDVIDYFYWFPPPAADCGWWTGDFDYDGDVDFDDYDLIDYAYWFQGGPLGGMARAEHAPYGSPLAAPEPATLALVAAGAILAAGAPRRRRR